MSKTASKTPRINSPGAPANPPQHLFETSGLEEGRPEPLTPQNWHHKQTGIDTAPPGMPEVSDPHPEDEGDPYTAPHPGGDAMPPSDTEVPHKNIGPNPARNSGHAPVRPHHPGGDAD